MNLIPGKLYIINSDRFLYTDQDCFVGASKPDILKDEVVLLLTDESILVNYHNADKFFKIKLLTKNGDIGYVYYNSARKMFTEI